jgi:crotonobetainyl-CoA:carnitine CoA-transferase CaiB-like acyl-CoA transferase
MLKDILILDLADEQGSFCSKLLADLGATVIRLEGFGADSSRDRDPYSYFYQNTNKLAFSVDLKTGEGKRAYRSLIKAADVLVESFLSRDLESLGLEPQRLRRANPRLIHLSITPFGRTGPRHDYHSSDSVVSAFGGQMYVSGRRAGPPVKLWGGQLYDTASLFGAVAVLIHLKKRKITGRGAYLDLSIQEAVASTLDRVLIDYFHGGRIAGRGNDDPGEGFSILPASDGYVLITVLRNWETLLELMASEERAGDLLDSKWRDRAYCAQRLDHIAAVVGEWTRRHTKHELFEIGQAMRFPWASIDSIEEVLKSPQLESRRFFTHSFLSAESPEVAIPGIPYKFSEYSPSPPNPSPLYGEHTQDLWDLIGGTRQDASSSHRGYKQCADEKILKGIRVLDLTRMLSGPYATRILADFGAEVIKIQSAESAERNDTEYFSVWNRNKQSMPLDLNKADARDLFLKLAAHSDVVVENYSPRVMANWGLEYERLREVNPDLVMVSISAMGHSGPWKDYVGFAPTFHALSGIISATSGEMNPPVAIGHAYGDVVAGLYAALAILSALEYRDRYGKGQHVDLSAYEAMCTLLGSAFVRQQAGSGFTEEYGIYRCAGEDRWCVISLENDEQRSTLCRIAGIAESTDELIGRWTAAQSAESIVEKLQAAGIAAGVVQNAEDLANDPRLAARNFFVELKHPVLGKMISDRTALWNWRHKPKGWKLFPWES